MRKAFSLIELLITVALAGAMAIFISSFIDIDTLNKDNLKSQFQANLNIISSAILQCKEFSLIMPIQTDGSLADDTLLNTLECNTSTPYPLDGGHGAFIPPPLQDFTAYTATQNVDEFYITTTAPLNTMAYEVMLDLNTTYSTQQYQLSDDSTTATLNFYFSR
jgi:prepilin-type N-terminal cleavage/methylation domain-containing protein